MSAWPTVPLGEVASFTRGITFRSGEQVSPDTEKSILCLRTKNVQTRLDLSDTWALPGHLAPNDPKKLLQVGDVLVSTANSWNLVGKCSRVEGLTRRATFGGFTSALRSTSLRLDQEYLYIWFNSPAVQAMVRNTANKTTNIANLSITRCETIQIPLPPAEEQRRISQLLTCARETSNQYGTLSSTLTKQGRALFRSIFGDPVRDWSADKKIRIGNIGRVQLGRQRAPKYQTGEHSYPYMRVANVLENRISLESVHTMDFDAKDFAAYKLEYGDILLNEGQSTELVGRPAMWRDEIADCCFQNTLVRFQADRSIVDPAYTLWLFLELYKAGEFARISSKTSNLAHLGAGRFGDMKVPVPPLGQQREFVRQITKLGELASTATTAQERAHELYDSLQYRAFRGEL